MFTALIENEETRVRALEELKVTHKECGGGKVELGVEDCTLVIKCCDCGGKCTLPEYSDFLVEPCRRITKEGHNLTIIRPYGMEPRRLVSGNRKML